MGDKIKRLAILGSTGSIGRQALEVVRAFPERLQVIGLAAGRNVELLNQQVEEFHPTLVSFQEPGQHLLPLENMDFCSLEEITSHASVDLVLVATVGSVGLGPTIAALEAGKCVALANKEVLVMAGEIVSRKARQHGAKLLPVDSEHSAIWQCLVGENDLEVARLILTASGGAFRDRPLEELARVTPEEALLHPNWQMGRKVTVDSATLMNKGMEVIEARWLFEVPFGKIEVAVHRESVIHSMVEFVDGSIKAQLGPPDMRLPIMYALSYPERWLSPSFPGLDWTALHGLTFGKVDLERYPCLRLALEAGRQGGTYPAVLSAADEVAVQLFLEGRIGFLDIAGLVGAVLDRHSGASHPSLEDILAADAWAREAALNRCLQ